jgi:cell division protein FtsI/penicillin-binding protein 2
MEKSVDNFKKRASLLLWGVLVWAILATCWLFYYSVFARQKYIELGNKIAVRQGVYYAGRGRILDKNDRVLAWSEKYFDLYLMSSEDDPNIRSMTLRKVTEILPDAALHRVKDSNFLLKREISPEKIIALEPLLTKFPDVKIFPRNERKVIDYSEVRNYIGRVESSEGNQHGVNGIEKEFDSVLAGTAGIYEVMLDRHKNWVPGTWLLKRKAQSGNDIKLDISFEEIKNNEAGLGAK